MVADLVKCAFSTPAAHRYPRHDDSIVFIHVSEINEVAVQAHVNEPN